jgi:DNA-binding IclR family transcriptional regulator
VAARRTRRCGVPGPLERAPRIDLWVGLHDAGHATALGKCILGQLPPDDRNDYLSRHPLQELTPRTVVDRRRLRLPRPDEVAVDDGEYAVGVSCLAAAVPTPEGAGAVGVVMTPAAMGQLAARRTLLAGAGRVTRALTLS